MLHGIWNESGARMSIHPKVYALTGMRQIFEVWLYLPCGLSQTINTGSNVRFASNAIIIENPVSKPK